jgi:anti-anti-sigma factor
VGITLCVSPRVRVKLSQSGDVPVARVVGDFHTANARDVAERLVQAAGSGAHALIVDLAGLSFLDTAGVHALFVVHRQLARDQQQLLLVADRGSPVERILTLTGVAQACPLLPTLERALAVAHTSAE